MMHLDCSDEYVLPGLLSQSLDHTSRSHEIDEKVDVAAVYTLRPLRLS